MKNNWLSLILGLFLILLAFLGLPAGVKNIILIGAGTVVALMSFREIAMKKVIEDIDKENEEEKNSDSDVLGENIQG